MIFQEIYNERSAQIKEELTKNQKELLSKIKENINLKKEIDSLTEHIELLHNNISIYENMTGKVVNSFFTYEWDEFGGVHCTGIDYTIKNQIEVEKEWKNQDAEEVRVEDIPF